MKHVFPAARTAAILLTLVGAGLPALRAQAQPVQSEIEALRAQIQELAARRLEAILDPRTVKPSLLEQLRRGAGAPVELVAPEPAAGFSFEDDTMYESQSGFVRFMRRLLQPVLKLFFNPNPLIQALNTQAKLNLEAGRREQERERRQGYSLPEQIPSCHHS